MGLLAVAILRSLELDTSTLVRDILTALIPSLGWAHVDGGAKPFD